jgi:pimeloyl-ACP methyl ester carboxylesterase
MDRRKFIATVAMGASAMATTTAQAKTKSHRLYQLPGTSTLQMRRMGKRGGPPVLYIHGATFPSALSVGYRFGDGKSWEDSLNSAGFDVWAFDFEGFGGSSRPSAFGRAGSENSPQLRASDAVLQIKRAVDFIQARTRTHRVSLLAHSWGGVPAASFAATYPDQVEKLVLFAPPCTRPSVAMANSATPPATAPPLPAWRYLTVPEQLARFVNDTPAGHANVLGEPTLSQWGPTWLATDPNSATRVPPSVQIPTGPQADIMALWTGNDLFDPSAIDAKALVVRGAWDRVCSAQDVERLIARMAPNLATSKVIPDSGHLAHLETNRALLWSEVNTFLSTAASR